jgi:hypothetical protein
MTQIMIDRALVEQALETIEGLTRDRLFTAEWAGKHGAPPRRPGAPLPPSAPPWRSRRGVADCPLPCRQSR